MFRHRVGFDIQRTVHCDYSYNESQRDSLFLSFILVKNATCFGQSLLSIIMSLNTVFTAMGLCRTSYVDCLLARSGPDLASRQST
jgi:hypothetical protein